MSKKQKKCYVLVQEHYHFPPNDSDMVAATPLKVVGESEESRDYIKIQAHRLARTQQEKFGGDIKEHESSSGHEYRVWIDSPNPNADKFVFVVRETEYVD